MTARPSVTSRISTSRSLGPHIQSDSTTLISASTAFTGTQPISLGPNVIIQLRARMTSAYGPINISENCLISERASIGLLSPPAPTQAEGEPTGVNLAPGVVIESGATVEATCIGAYTIIEAGAKVGKGAAIGEHCKVCAMVQLGEGAVVGDGMVVYGSGWGERRSEQGRQELEGMRRKAVTEQIEVLRRCWTGK
ncbi:hypothetical protein JMJ35_003815 [Cladonia borealis]|uniref:Dynactin subunit 6 n=1 Tax=Cladonia borealis TaxID=184061 RepID=A0AA39V312_9LECA|nr:hypothetical protein JMJ35_003815 [Cladonia borealis]